MVLNYLISIWLVAFNVLAAEENPEFKGGQKSLFGFISRSLIYPEYSRQNCLQGTVQVSFTLDRSGKIVDSKIEKGFGTDLDDEALRVVRLTSGRWIVPATFDVSQYLTIPINFSLVEYNCSALSADDLREAIAAYKAREDLTNAVTNFYIKKHAGDFKKEDESHILALKEQLGFTERFIDRVIRQAQLKLKQGDKESACEDFTFVRNIGSTKADKIILEKCN